MGSFMCVRPHLSLHTVYLGEDDVVKDIRSIASDILINGGYFVFRRDIFEHLGPGEELVEQPFQRLIKERLLLGQRYGGFWATMDTFKGPSAFDKFVGKRPGTLEGLALGHMNRLAFFPETSAGLHVLCLGAHSDDIEIGCGGTLLSWLAAYPSVTVTWVVLSADEARTDEARRSAASFLAGAAHQNVVIKHFRESYFTYVGADIKDYFETLKAQVSPDVVFTHYRHDRHQDHRVVSDLTWNTFRNQFILEYEIPKYDGDLGVPNVFVDVPEPTCQKKIALLLEHFKTQHSKPWFDRETFAALMRLRGVEGNSESRFAEAFYARKLKL